MGNASGCKRISVSWEGIEDKITITVVDIWIIEALHWKRAVSNKSQFLMYKWVKYLKW
jgi:hypothetical protein